jgi:hypothetical protein
MHVLMPLTLQRECHVACVEEDACVDAFERWCYVVWRRVHVLMPLTLQRVCHGAR